VQVKFDDAAGTAVVTVPSADFKYGDPNDDRVLVLLGEEASRGKAIFASPFEPFKSFEVNKQFSLPAPIATGDGFTWRHFLLVPLTRGQPTVVANFDLRSNTPMSEEMLAKILAGRGR
jgi:hypothetical protein